jgi:glycosyltransferase involved in cell wall biosynthesis
MIRISVVIPCYNGAHTLAETLDALVSQQWQQPWEVLLSDNGSRDHSVRLFRQYAAHQPEIPMRVVDASQRRGQPHALNTGVRAARGRSVAFCDADDAPAPGWLAAMGDALEAHDFVAARWAFGALNSGWVFEYGNSLQLTELKRFGGPPYLPYAGGGTIAFTKAVFDKVGEFDHTLPCLHDLDFCFRAQLNGFPLHYVPEAVMRIRSRGDLAGIYRQAYNHSKYRVLLAKRYRGHGPAPAQPWRRISRRWQFLAKAHVKIATRRWSPDMVERAQLHRRLGIEMGRLVGMIRYRTPPF